jgi:formate hydrogenlyase subunit 3/multisubunit Na+/H+ antiporter MnhD subunit
MADQPLALIGGLVHLVHQGLMKITLFFCAGNLAETLGIHRISEMNGVARRLPLTMAAFTVGALGMIGIPPTVGFISKWYLGLGGLASSNWWVIGVLVASSLLNAGYFLPIVTAAWFGKQAGPWPEDRGRGRLETEWMILLPPLITAFIVMAVGAVANAQFSPLAWVRFIVKGYGL